MAGVACDPGASLCWLHSLVPETGSGWTPGPAHRTQGDLHRDSTATTSPHCERVAGLELHPPSWYPEAPGSSQHGEAECRDGKRPCPAGAESIHHWSQAQSLDLSDYIKSYLSFLLRASLVWVFFTWDPNSPNCCISECTRITPSSASWLKVFANLHHLSSFSPIHIYLFSQIWSNFTFCITLCLSKFLRHVLSWPNFWHSLHTGQ